MLIRDQAEEALGAVHGVGVWAGGAEDVGEVAHRGRGALEIEACVSPGEDEIVVEFLR